MTCVNCKRICRHVALGGTASVTPNGMTVLFLCRVLDIAVLSELFLKYVRIDFFLTFFGIETKKMNIHFNDTVEKAIHQIRKISVGVGSW